MNNIFLQIGNSDGTTIFMYVLITIIILAIFKNIDMGVNIIVAIIISLIIILFLNSLYIDKQEAIQNMYKEKYDSIVPKTDTVKKYPEIVDFLFSIQDFYVYNVPAYEDMVDSIENILLLYDESQNDNSKAGIDYGLIINEQKEAVNSLHSLIYYIPSDPRYMDKLNIAVRDLDTIIYNILDDVYNLNKLYIFNNGYDRFTIELDNINMPKPENHYNIDDPYTFDVF